jgi:hypothetical protein
MAATVSNGDEYAGLRLEGRYYLLGSPIAGGFSLVFRAEDLLARKGEPALVAVKILRPDLRGPLPERLIAKLEDYFELEIEALSRARHAHIVRFLDSGEARDKTGQPFKYQVLEYMSGGMLEERCADEPLSMVEALEYLSQLASALGEAHRLGYIHRDLKPENFLLTADGAIVKLADFGVARLEGDVRGITSVGTVVFAPPEHNPQGPGLLRGKLTPASDIYALAKSFYRMVCGERPHEFSGQPITHWPPSVANEPWAKVLLRVLHKATQDDPDKRHQSAAEFLGEVQRAVGWAVPKRTARRCGHESQRNGRVGASHFASALAGLRDIRLTRLVALTIIVLASLVLLTYGAWRLKALRLHPTPRGHPTRGVSLDVIANQSGDFSGIVAGPPDDMKVNLRVQAGVSKSVRCVISYQARVRTLGGLKKLGDNDEKWFEVEVIDPGDDAGHGCQTGQRGWAYGKLLLTFS